jgi:hypothetical protein
MGKGGIPPIIKGTCKTIFCDKDAVESGLCSVCFKKTYGASISNVRRSLKQFDDNKIAHKEA